MRMRASRAVFSAVLATAFMGASVSEASARWDHYRGHGGPGLIGGLIVGAATIATLPLAIIAGAVNPEPRGYYGPPEGAPPPPRPYGYGPGYYAAPPGYYGRTPRRPYGPPPGYYGYGR